MNDDLGWKFIETLIRKVETEGIGCLLPYLLLKPEEGKFIAEQIYKVFKYRPNPPYSKIHNDCLRTQYIKTVWLICYSNNVQPYSELFKPGMSILKND